MTHLSNVNSEVLPAVILTILTFFLFLTLYKKRRETRANALDWPMAIFGTTFLLGFTQLIKIYYHDDLSIFNKVTEVSQDASLATDPVRVIHLILLLILYFMAEQFLGDGLHSLRLFILGFLVGIYIFLSVYFYNTDIIIYNDDLWSKASDTSLDSLVFDILQLFSVGMIFYTYFLQHQVSDDPDFKRYLKIILAAVSLFAVASLLEVLEHLFGIGSINAFMTAIPTFLILAYFYIRYPNFVYLAPCNIKFLQLVSKNGQLLYAAEFGDDLDTSDFLVAPSLTSVGIIISELVGKDRDEIKIKKFEYASGSILFEQVNDLRVILQTDRPSGILKRSMRYFVREFDKNFGYQLESYTGRINENPQGIGPDDVFKQCIPIVQSRIILSTVKSVSSKNE